MMQRGNYYGNHQVHGWITVEVVAGLHNAVLWRGCSVALKEFTGDLIYLPLPVATPAIQAPSDEGGRVF